MKDANLPDEERATEIERQHRRCAEKDCQVVFLLRLLRERGAAVSLAVAAAKRTPNPGAK